MTLSEYANGAYTACVCECSSVFVINDIAEDTDNYKFGAEKRITIKEVPDYIKRLIVTEFDEIQPDYEVKVVEAQTSNPDELISELVTFYFPHDW